MEIKKIFFVFLDFKRKTDMAQAIITDKITFKMKIQNVSQLSLAHTKAFNVHGLKWKFKIEKNIANTGKNRMENTLGVSLDCSIPNDRKYCMCAAQAKMKLVPFKDNSYSVHGYMMGVYDSENTKWGLPSFIEWNKLFSDGYVQDNAVLFEVELKIGPLESKDCNSLTMKTVEDKHKGEKVTQKLMKLILNRVDDDFLATKSTKFIFNDLIWYITAEKWFGCEKELFLVALHYDNEHTSDDWSCELAATLKLMPVNPNAELIEISESFKFDKNEEMMLIGTAEWSYLEQSFIRTSTMEMILELEVKQHQ